MKIKFFKKNKFPSWWGTVSPRVAHLSCLLVLLTATFCAVAQNGVNVSNLEMGAGTVTFHVSWDKNTIPPEATPWSDTVWVFVDYNDAGVMKRLPLSAGATLTATSAPGVGKVREEPGNDKGVWVVGNAKTSGAGSFSATVQLHTATASTGGSESRPLHGACVYASNYPPVGEYTSATHISFTGTPPYDLVLNTGSGTASERVYNAYSLPAGYTVRDFTDATGAPGIIKCVPLSNLSLTSATICSGQSATLTASATGASSYSLNNTSWQTTTNFVVNPTTTTGYTLYVRSSAGCTASLTNAGKVTVNPSPLAPMVVDATFCFGLPGQLQAVASGDATIAWYDAPAEGNLLYTGNVLSLTPLYNNAMPYYAQAVLDNNCVSARIQANYTVNNCVMSGDCPNYTVGGIGSVITPAACASFYPGQIGATSYPAACVAFDAGSIGRSQ